jgi:hypothetical protein
VRVDRAWGPGEFGRLGFPALPPRRNGLRVLDALEIPQEGRICMASSSQKKTTMAKLNREAALRERRQKKQAKKDARKEASVGQAGPASGTPSGDER